MSGFSADWHSASHSISARAIRKMCDCRRGTIPFRRHCMLQSLEHDPEKWTPVSRLCEALARLTVWLDASAGEGRPDKIMLQLI